MKKVIKIDWSKSWKIPKKRGGDKDAFVIMAKQLGVLENSEFTFSNYRDWQVSQATEDKMLQKLKNDNGVPEKFEWNKSNRHKYFYPITFNFHNYGPMVNGNVPEDVIWLNVKEGKTHG
jgi:hypothetical protein